MDPQNIGNDIYELIAELYPICRSITGNGFRESMRILQKHIPLGVSEVASGTQVLDWVVPKEWNIRDAWIKDSKGEKVVDFQKSNLHVLNYSAPVKQKVKRAELKDHLYSLPEHVDWIPYRTSYYKENWGFCVTQRQLESMTEDEYDVFIDSSLEDGHLTFGEYLIKGDLEDEFLISCHSCHPSLCNDNLSGMGLAVHLAKHLSQRKLRYSYRFLFIPGTIGSITWLALNKNRAAKIQHGLVVACVGDAGNLHYKKSRRGDAVIDRAVSHVLSHSKQAYEIIDFFPYGYDERQYCSPGFDLAVGSLSRTPHGQFPQYHTSADNLEFISPAALGDSFAKYLEVIDVVEGNRCYSNTNPFGEPQLGKRGLYGAFGGRKDSNTYEMAMLWVLNLSDGKHSLLDIAEKSGNAFPLIQEAAQTLLEHGLLVQA
jgi:aminopeptidase-like protein